MVVGQRFNDAPDTDALESQQVETRLRKKILALELAPGQCVTHAYLCDLLDSGRMPLREALQRLSKKG